MNLKQLENHESKATHVLEFFDLFDEDVLKLTELSRSLLAADGRTVRLLKIESSSDKEPSSHKVFFIVA